MRKKSLKMYRPQRTGVAGMLFTAAAAIAFAACLALIVFFAYILYLRTSYRAMVMTFNDALLATPAEERLIGREEFYEADLSVADYYSVFLLDRYTVVFSRKERPENDRTLRIRTSEGELSLTGYGDGTEIQVVWRTPDQTDRYTVRAQISFQQLSAYYQNFERRMQAG